jgi:signal transduction histidine kinase
MSRALSVFRTLRGRLVLLVCFATLPALLFTFYAASRERAAVLQRVEKESLLLAQLASREHTHQLEGAKTLLHRLAGVLGQHPEPGRSGPCPDFLPPLLAGYPQFTTIGILSPRGELLCSAHPAPDAPSFAGNTALQRALRSTEVELGDYTLGPVVRRPVLHLAYALRDAAGAPRSVLFVGLDLQWLDRVVEQADLPRDYALLIVDREGRVQGRSPGAPWPAPDEHTRAELARRVGAARPAAVDLPGVGRRFLVATPLRGIPGASVVASLPYAPLLGEANRAFYRTVAALVLLTAVTLACVLFAAELSVLRVLRGLSRTARRFGVGDLGARAELTSDRGELADLARAFNAMADALAARQREASEAQERLRALSTRLAAAKETEAGRIARELHDELGQVLTSVKLEVAALERACAPPPGDTPAPDPLRASVSRITHRLDDAVGSVRRIAADLRPPVLDRLGLAAALQAQVREAEQRTGLAIVLDVDVEEPVDWLPAITLYRVVGEALTNVVRHADATQVAIDLRQRGDEYCLFVNDDGRGISAAQAANARSLGILGMRERCLLVGGTFEISSPPGGGTAIVVRIPCQPPTTADAAHPAR